MKHIIGGHGVYGMLAMMMAEAGRGIMTDELQRVHPPKVYPENVRHQGARERARRLKRSQG